MDPKSEKIEASSSLIEEILDRWGYGRHNSAQRAEKKSHVLFWLENFQPSEIDDALLILARLQYKDDHVIRTAIDNLAAEVARILSASLPDARFFPLGLSPSSSGGMFLYDYRKALGLSERQFPASSFKDQTGRPSVLVFFDDVIGSGNQAIRFYQHHLKDLQTELIYVSVFAFQRGLDRIINSASFTHVLSGITLSDEECAFADNSAVFADPIVRSRIRALALKYGQMLYPDHPLGYDDSQALLVFPHNTPNNTLPIIWAGPKNEKALGVIWNPVWQRRKLVAHPLKTPGNLRAYIESVNTAFVRWRKRYVNVVGRERLFEIPLYAKETDWDSSRTQDEVPERREGEIKYLRDTILERRMILLGDAGMGKTSTLQYLSHLDAAEGLSRALPPRRIPVYIELKMLTGETSLERTIFDKLAAVDVDAENYLSDGQVTLYLDGLNEIMSSIRRHVWVEILNLFRKYDSLSVMLSSRPQTYKQEFPGVPCFMLQKMTGPQIKSFLDKNASNPEAALSLWSQIRDNQHLRRLLGTPLLLFMLLSIVERTGNIPRTEGLIIREFINGLFARERQEKDVDFVEAEFRLLLQKLAFEGISRKGSNAALTREEALSILSDRKRHYGLDLNLLTFLQRSAELGILAEESGLYSFSHQLYQDYFAAEEIASSGGSHG